MTITLDRRIQGAKNRSVGKVFEGLVSNSFEYYKKHNIAMIDKTPEPMRPIRSMGGGHFECIYEKKAQPDYKGVLNNGRAFVCETKCTTNQKMHQSVVTKWQAAYLDRTSKLGAWCYVIVGFFGSGNLNVYMVPWEVWSQMDVFYGHKYVTETDLKNYKVDHKSGRFMFFREG